MVVVAGKEPPESLFMKELKRRGMTPTSLLEDSATGRSPFPGLMEEMDLVEEEPQRGDGGRGSVKRKGVLSADYEKGLLNQRERSMALNSEGLEVGQLLKTLISSPLSFLQLRCSYLASFLFRKPGMRTLLQTPQGIST